MFLDEKKLYIKAGKGGDGASLFRREKYVPFGGPDGGDGGRGGSIIAVGCKDMNTLTHLSHIDRVVAEEGEKGGHNRRSGERAENIFVQFPLGTQITRKNRETGEVEGEVIEILEDKQEILLAKGGNGGWGNWHFKSSINQAPERYNVGLDGDTYDLVIVLKLIADIGLVGLPNAGKSTILSVISAAKPKIADYPFTTLEPQLGVYTIPSTEVHYVIADLPGLIEDAYIGKGLGDKFLKHLERTRVVWHCLSTEYDIDQIIANYKVIRNELSKWSEILLNKPEAIVLTKIDMIPEEDREKYIKDVLKAFKKAKIAINSEKIIAISAVSHTNLDKIIDILPDKW